MKSIKTKMILLTVSAIVATTVIATLMGVYAIRNIGVENSERMLTLLCESGEKNLNSYFDTVEQAVNIVSAYVESDLKAIDIEDLGDHLNRVKDIFQKMTFRTSGILTYYYRIDPEVSDEKGFWYVNLDGEGFREHEVTDITLYDTNDTSALVWFTVPKFKGESIWLPPYVTDNLDNRVVSYNTPVYRNNTFIGVIGIEIDYLTIADLVDHITLYENGYAFINDEDGTIICHPRIDAADSENQPKVPDGLLSDSSFVRYTYNGVEKEAVRLPLDNGMYICVTVPVSEINSEWQRWIFEVSVVSAVLLSVFIFLTLRFTSRITKPLRNLTEAARQVNRGNYDVKLDYSGSDEVGVLSEAFGSLTSHLKKYIGDLSDLAYADALTSVHNKGAFDIYVSTLDQELEKASEPPQFGVCIFDCNNLKTINDVSGHDKGDLYLKAASRVICRAFSHSPVFRIGGDEFAVVLLNDDFKNRDNNLKEFDRLCSEKREDADVSWERVDIARGVAVYDPAADASVNDVVRRADRLMYEDKWRIKHGKEENGEQG